MTTQDETAKLILELLAEIAKREKKKAIERDEYFDAFFATILEGWFRDARKSIQ